MIIKCQKVNKLVCSIGGNTVVEHLTTYPEVESLNLGSMIIKCQKLNKLVCSIGDNTVVEHLTTYREVEFESWQENISLCIPTEVTS